MVPTVDTGGFASMQTTVSVSICVSGKISLNTFFTVKITAGAH